MPRALLAPPGSTDRDRATRSRLRIRIGALAAALAAGVLGAGTLAAVPAAAGTATAAPVPAAATTATTSPAPTPIMGFNDWNAFGCNVDESLITATADYFATSGLKAAGYRYVDIDDCWSMKQRNAAGDLVADPVKFPHGIAWLADYVHARGLKLGIYSSAGDLTCAGYPASFGHETQDAKLWASWGVDLLKYDNCGARSTPDTQAGFVQRYKAMGDALHATGRPMVYSLCEWGQYEPWTWGGQFAQSWRTTGDIRDSWDSLKSIIASNLPLAPYAKPGQFNDPDMLEVGNGGMTDTEYRTHFSMWAMMAAPLLIGTDLRRATPATLAIYTNRDVIAVDQDPLGIQGAVVASQGGTSVVSKPMTGGDRAVALYNPTDAATTITTTAAQVGLPAAAAYTTRDLYSKVTTETAGTIRASVPAHGTVVYRVSPTTAWSGYAPATSVGITSSATGYPGSDVTLAAGGTGVLTGTLSDAGLAPLTDVRVTRTVPAGWTLRATSPSTTARVPSGGSFTATGALTAPANATSGVHAVTVTTTYRWGTHTAVVTNLLTVRVLPPAPTGRLGLSGLAWVSATNGWGPVEIDMSNGETGAGDGHPLTIRGTVHAHGLGTNATSDITYYLGGNCTKITGGVGIDDEVAGSVARVAFQVFADGRKVLDSGPLTATSPLRTGTANVSGATFVRLHVDSLGDTTSDHADWVDPVLTCR